MSVFTNHDIDGFLADVNQAEIDRESEHFKTPDVLVDDMFSPEAAATVHKPIGEDIKFGPGELTIWAGGAGAGKSLLLGDVINTMLMGETCAIASLEMPLRDTVRRMIQQSVGRPPTREDAEEWADVRKTALWLYDQIDTIPAERILAMVRYAHGKLGCTQVVIDSLTKCGLPQDGAGFLSKQTEFVDRLQHLVKHLGIHVHLVAHLRKSDGARKEMHDIRGASQITDLADRVLILSRNFLKERILQKSRAIPAECWDENFAAKVEEAEKASDAKIQCEKQRSDGYVGDIPLMFDRLSLRHTKK